MYTNTSKKDKDSTQNPAKAVRRRTRHTTPIPAQRHGDNGKGKTQFVPQENKCPEAFASGLFLICLFYFAVSLAVCRPLASLDKLYYGYHQHSQAESYAILIPAHRCEVEQSRYGRYLENRSGYRQSSYHGCPKHLVVARQLEYALPLIQGEPDLPKQDSLPRFAKLKKVLAK